MSNWKKLTIHNEANDSSHNRKYFAYFEKPIVNSNTGRDAFQTLFARVELENTAECPFNISMELFAFVGKFENQTGDALQPPALVTLSKTCQIKIGEKAGGGSQLVVDPPKPQGQAPSIREDDQKAPRNTFEVTCSGSFQHLNKFVVGLARKVKFDYEAIRPVAVLPCLRNVTYKITPQNAIYISRDDGDTAQGTVISAPEYACLVRLEDTESEFQIKETSDGFFRNGRLVTHRSTGDSSSARRPDPPRETSAAEQPSRAENEAGPSEPEGPEGVEEKWDISLIREWDIVFVIDNTKSMLQPVKRNQRNSRWEMLRVVMQEVAEIAAREDEDGVDVRFLLRDDILKKKGVTSGNEILTVLRNVDLRISHGRTYFEPILQSILSPFVREIKSYGEGKRKREVKPLNIIIITDGKANDKVETMNRLVRTATQLDELDAGNRQLGIQFVQVGDDQEATTFLGNLGNEIKHKYKRAVSRLILLNSVLSRFHLLIKTCLRWLEP